MDQLALFRSVLSQIAALLLCASPPARFKGPQHFQFLVSIFPGTSDESLITRGPEGISASRAGRRYAPCFRSFPVGGTGQQAYNSAMKHLTLPIVIEGDADGYFVSCPALQGCYSQGGTYEEAVENIKDAIRLHIEDRLADGEEIPEHLSVSLSTVEVAV